MKFKTALIAAAACALPVLAQAEVVRIVTDVSYPPFSKQAADGSITGFDPDIARAVCAEAKLQCDLKAMDFDGIIPALQAKKYDVAIASMSITPERAKVVNFSDMYFNVPGRLLAKEGTKIDDAWYKGKNIGVLRSAVQEQEGIAKLKPKGASIKIYGKITDAFLDLSSNRLDAVFLESTVGEEDFLKTPKGRGYAFVGPVFNDPKFYQGCGIAVQKGNKELLAKINVALKKILADGTYKKIQGKYFKNDIYPFKN
ncbi:transporter substrate-binding domain-containing protein [Vogesella sp. LIG4]|uniref:transporter substrate-binding domain-containing protein n=1 Tax=Vogesella sp. LIG4 TaxID=1192162 RepID=UPI0008200CFE|nr:transporter substrate-binding domain-containing protein [Vogesella sp. LIG4]SCK06830.1 arginine/ornithine transport system substrate-binding protein [Vogesella sp. LIG4]